MSHNRKTISEHTDRGGEGGLGRTGRNLPPKALVIVIAVSLLIVSFGAALLLLSRSSGDDATTGPKRAVIVDQLSLTQPNMRFVASTIGLLVDAGYEVDYYPGEEVTVDFYRHLPAFGYDLILLRVHAATINIVNEARGEETGTEFVGLFTGEPYADGKYPEQQIGGLARGRHYGGGPPVFGITTSFVSDSMLGDFDGAQVIMMGCDGLRSRFTAEAFIDKGASSFVSWSKPVSAAHTDSATQRLVDLLVIDGLEVEDAVAQTAAEIGPDPDYGAELRILSGR